MPEGRDTRSAQSSAEPSNASALTSLKRKRAGIKASCTRIEHYVNGVGKLTPGAIANIEERRTRLESHWKNYDEVQSQIEAIDEGEMADHVSFEDAFYSLAASIRTLVTRPFRADRSATASPVALPSLISGTDSIASVRLPKLNLPTFAGKYKGWSPFKDTFTSIIHNHVTLSGAQKLQYLRASLTGDAFNIISSLEISDHNYAVAWETLLHRYDNKRVIVQTHIKAILGLPVASREGARDLRQLMDSASRYVLALKALQRPVDSWDDLLLHILTAKLDSVTLRD